LRDRSSASKARLASSFVIIAFTYVTQLTYGLRRVEALTVQPVSSGDDGPLPEQDFGFYTPAIRAVELVDGKIAATWMLLHNGQS